jgi:lipopolysaccharide export system protein LptA
VSPSLRVRALALVTIALGASFAACVRGPRARPAPGPSRRDTSRAAARPETTARVDTAARAAARDSARRDSLARDSAARALADTTRKPTPRPRRRNAEDPTSRCHAVAINDGPDRPPASRLQSLTDASGKAITYVGGGVVARCQGIRNRLQADSAEYYQATGTLFLVNNVVYDEPARVHLTSNRLTYYTSDERIVADGNVVMTTPSGTMMTGPNAEYLREAPALRDRSKLTATGRPQLRVITTPQRRTADSARRAAPTAERDTATIIANTIIDEGDSLVYASGQVQIIRPDVLATSDSATFDQGTEIAHLVNNAQIRGQQNQQAAGQQNQPSQPNRSFTLSGTLIDLFSRERELTRVLARGVAHVVSGDLDLKSDTVDLRVRESRVEHATAWGPSRAVATSPDRDVVADSIDASLPDQRIRVLRALRRAVARSLPDSTRIASKERDLLAGDTIIAYFDTLAAARDTTRNPPVRQILADGHASSLYQIASNEGRTAPPGINYVRGRRIRVDFDSNQVQTVTVMDSASGVYLEPSNDSTGDTTQTRRGRTAPAPRRGGGSTPTIRRPGGRPGGRPQNDDRVDAGPGPIADPRRLAAPDLQPPHRSTT